MRPAEWNTFRSFFFADSDASSVSHVEDSNVEDAASVLFESVESCCVVTMV